jgi:tetratricopeptide (TPR) repeat protein
MRTLQDDLTASLLSAATDAGVAEALERVQMRAELRQIERQLAEGIAYSEMAVGDALSTSLSQLPTGAVAIELLVVRDVPAARRGDSAAAHRYMALVVAGSPASLRLIELGLCDELDQAITGMRDSLASEPWTDDAPTPDWRRLSRFLGSRVLTPIEKDIAAATHVLIAPDGLMGALPFEILMTPDGEYLIDKVKGRVSYLMRFGELGRAREVFTKGAMPLVLAGPDFDLPKATVGKRASLDYTDRLLTRALGGAHFKDLSGARAEGVAVAELLGVEPLVGVWALAPELRRNTSPEIIHVSTHGFSLPFKDAEVSASLAAPLGNALESACRARRSDAAQRPGHERRERRARRPRHSTGGRSGPRVRRRHPATQPSTHGPRRVVGVPIGSWRHLDRRRRARIAPRVSRSRRAQRRERAVDVPDDSSKTLIAHFYQRLLEQATRVEALADARNVVRDSHPRDPVHWAGFVLDGYFGELARFSPLSDLRVAQVSFKSWVKGKDDAEGMAKLAKRLVSGAESDADEMLSALSLRTAILKPGLPEDTRLFVLEQLGDLANRLGDNDNAVAWYREILATTSLPQERRPRLSYVLAKILQQMGRTDESITGYGEVLKLAPSAVLKARTLANRGLAYLVKGKYADGLTDFTTVIDSADAPDDQRFLARNESRGRAGCA